MPCQGLLDRLVILLRSCCSGCRSPTTPRRKMSMALPIRGIATARNHATSSPSSISGIHRVGRLLRPVGMLGVVVPIPGLVDGSFAGRLTAGTRPAWLVGVCLTSMPPSVPGLPSAIKALAIRRFVRPSTTPNNRSRSSHRPAPKPIPAIPQVVTSCRKRPTTRGRAAAGFRSHGTTTAWVPTAPLLAWRRAGGIPTRGP